MSESYVNKTASWNHLFIIVCQKIITTFECFLRAKNIVKLLVRIIFVFRCLSAAFTFMAYHMNLQIIIDSWHHVICAFCSWCLLIKCLRSFKTIKQKIKNESNAYSLQFWDDNLCQNVLDKELLLVSAFTLTLVYSFWFILSVSIHSSLGEWLLRTSTPQIFRQILQVHAGISS